ncbi:DEAD/DEAH box helicase [Alteromonas halophila]|uniref:RNA helicase n=1 Tax=Alteromonas halophila TaxID=516698 RepID=A0A918N043_9ALTE|nr:DEAD/DEAH box helicase [Alteromonas halophila]GGW88349.1 RNA helicase [Alteromonas halophila]
MHVSDLPVNHTIIKRLSDKGITDLTEIQQQTIVPAIQGKDVIASSKTGSGKTFAYLIPAINRLLKDKPLSRKDPRAVILAPTRELAKQVFIETKNLISKMSLQCALVVGGENYNEQTKVLRRNPHIVVGTAGRVADHLEDKSFFLNGLELLIIDEADRMLDLGFAGALTSINEAADHRKRQTMLFSATLDNIELAAMTKKLTTAAVRVAVGQASAVHEDIHQQCYFADHVEHKDALLARCLDETNFNQAVIFCATREDTSRIATLLNAQQRDAVALSGELLQSQRANIMSEFGRGQHSILVTTDVASRGLDLVKVGLVINYDLPKQPDEYIHRIGRTGRAGRQGQAISLVGPRDWKSFAALKEQLAYPLACEPHPALGATFSGFAIRKKVPKKSGTPNKKAASAGASAPRKKKRVNTMAGEDVGMMPVKRRNTDSDS